MPTIRPARYTRAHPCPVCGGDPTLPPSQGTRCWGYLTPDGAAAFCTRPEHAGNAPFSDGASAYVHRLTGHCACGIAHGGPVPTAPPHSDAPRGRTPLVPQLIDAVYRSYLARLPLRPAHVEHLAHRGKADLEAARAHGYGSLPFGYREARQLVDALIAEFGEDVLELVPGFYRDKETRRLQTHTANRAADAYVIPYQQGGLITGIQRGYILGGPGKYATFANGGDEFCTVAGPGAGLPYLVEGGHKAHVAARADTIRLIGLPGLALRDAHLDLIASLGEPAVAVAVDADWRRKPEVERARARWIEKLQARGLDVFVAEWEEADGKGLDDLLKNGHRPRRRMVPRRPEVSGRRPHVTPAPAPIPKGRPLADVQLETRARIRAVVDHPHTYRGRVAVIAAPPSVGKTSEVVEAILLARRAGRIVVATKAKAAEIEARDPDRIHAIHGRNATNCANHEVAAAAGERGYDVASLVCGPCPFRYACEQSGYYVQFRQGGTLVGAVEMLYSRSFLEHGEVVVLDDATLERAMIDRRHIIAEQALRMAALPAVGSGPLRELLTAVQRAIDAVREDAGGGYAPKRIGPLAWDELARAAGGAGALVRLIEALPDVRDLLPAPTGEGGQLTVEDVEAAPPAVLEVLVRLLREELDDFRSGAEFNSGLTIHGGGVELLRLRPAVVNAETGAPLLADRAVLVLDATPTLPLYESFAVGHRLTLRPEAVYAPDVGWPENVTITQLADRFFGKTAIATPEGRAATLRSLAGAMADYPGDRPAVLTFKGLKDDVVAAGIPEDRVLTYFGGARGINSLENADVLYVVGRPAAPDATALQLAHVLHRGGPPLRSHLVMREEAYAGYCGPEGGGRAITVLDFEDRRVARLYRAHREDELLQAIHRARPLRVGDPQLTFFEADGQRIARQALPRQRLRIVVITAHPVPGIPVHELITGEERVSVNRARRQAARARVAAAVAQLEEEGVTVSVSTVKRIAGGRKDMIAAALREREEQQATPEIWYRPVTTDSSSDLCKGGDRAVPISLVPLEPGLGREPEPQEDPLASCTRCEMAVAENRVCWGCEDRPCAGCGDWVGTPLRRYCWPCMTRAPVRVS